MTKRHTVTDDCSFTPNRPFFNCIMGVTELHSMRWWSHFAKLCRSTRTFCYDMSFHSDILLCYVVPLGHFIMIPRQPLFVEGGNTNCICFAFDLVSLELVALEANTLIITPSIRSLRRKDKTVSIRKRTEGRTIATKENYRLVLIIRFKELCFLLVILHFCLFYLGVGGGFGLLFTLNNLIAWLVLIFQCCFGGVLLKLT